MGSSFWGTKRRVANALTSLAKMRQSMDNITALAWCCRALDATSLDDAGDVTGGGGGGVGVGGGSGGGSGRGSPSGLGRAIYSHNTFFAQLKA